MPSMAYRSITLVDLVRNRLIRQEGIEVCPNNHGPDEIEVRDDGTRLCTACRAKYQGRKNAARRVNQSKRAMRATRSGSNNNGNK